MKTDGCNFPRRVYRGVRGIHDAVVGAIAGDLIEVSRIVGIALIL